MKTESKQKIRKVRRKVFSLLLAVVLTVAGIDLSLFTTTVMADDIVSGKIGADVTWSYDGESNTLHISGTGNMQDNSYYTPFKDTGILEKEGMHVTIDVLGIMYLSICRWRRFRFRKA